MSLALECNRYEGKDFTLFTTAYSAEDDTKTVHSWGGR